MPRTGSGRRAATAVPAAPAATAPSAVARSRRLRWTGQAGGPGCGRGRVGARRRRCRRHRRRPHRRRWHGPAGSGGPPAPITPQPTPAVNGGLLRGTGRGMQEGKGFRELTFYVGDVPGPDNPAAHAGCQWRAAAWHRQGYAGRQGLSGARCVVGRTRPPTGALARIRAAGGMITAGNNWADAP